MKRRREQFVKWKCTYQPEEERAATADLKALRRLHPGARCRKKKGKGREQIIYMDDGPSKANKP